MVIIKLYLNKTEDIRRLELPSLELNIASLIDKAYSLLDIPKTEEIKLQWKDSEDDLITFSTDRELRDALDHHGGSLCLHIHVSYTPAISSSPHPGICCNICRDPVVGHRIICLQCPDYDLCIRCHMNGLHREHLLLSLPKPESLSSVLFSDIFAGARSSSLSRLNPSFNRPSKRRIAKISIPPLISRHCDKTSDLDSTNDSTASGSAASQTQSQDCLPIHQWTSFLRSRHNIDPVNRDISSVKPAPLQRVDNIASKQDFSSEPQLGLLKVKKEPCTEAMDSHEFVMVDDKSLPKLPMHIQAAKEQMELMGYVENSSCWLTALLKRYNGDISKCLDIIHKQTSGNR